MGLAKHISMLIAMVLFSAACSDSCRPDLEGACTRRMSCQEINEQTAIVHTLNEESLRELVVCGQIQQEMMNALTYVLIDTLLTRFQVSVPRDVEHVSGSTFRTQLSTSSSEVSMTIEFLAGRQYSFGATGTPLPVNALDTASYFVGSSFSRPSDGGPPVMTFSSTGPLVELLGFDKDVSSPIVIDRDTLREASTSLFGTLVRSDIWISDRLPPGRFQNAAVAVGGDKARLWPQQDGASVQDGLVEFDYRVTAPPIPVAVALQDLLVVIADIAEDQAFIDFVSELAASTPAIPFVVDELMGRRDELDQSLEMTTWDVRYDLEQGGLTGGLQTLQESPDLKFVTTFEYAASATAQLQFSCAP